MEKPKTPDQKQIVQFEDELKSVTESIKNLEAGKKKTEEEIAALKLNDVLLGSENGTALITSLSSQYGQYSGLTIQEKIKIDSIDAEISVLNALLTAISQATSSPADEDIAQLKAQIEQLQNSTDPTQLNQLKSQSAALKDTISRVEMNGRLQEAACPAI